MTTYRTPLRWVGGKWSWRGRLAELFDAAHRSILLEPFLGGAGSLMGISPSRFQAGDTNEALIAFYVACRRWGSELADVTLQWPDSSEQYYKVREWAPEEGSIEAAARFLYLNRTSYLGLYRVNASGKFNTPYGGGGRLAVLDLRERLAALQCVLRRGKVRPLDFEKLLAKANGDELVFTDPPYGTGTDGPFGRYSPTAFSRDDHQRLRDCLSSCEENGCRVAVALASDESILKLYETYRIVHSWTRRGGRGEVVVVDPSFAEVLPTQGPLQDVGSWLNNPTWGEADLVFDA